MGGGSASASSSASSGIQFGNSQITNDGGGSKNTPLLILGGVALALIAGLFWVLSRKGGH